jgi:hypothetical protein
MEWIFLTPPHDGAPSPYENENCGTRQTMSPPAPSVSEGILSARDRFFLTISRITISATYGGFLRSHPCQRPWPSSSFPQKWESRHGQLGWHNKMMKTILLQRRGWPKARGGFQMGKAFPKWNPPRPSATADVHPSNGGDFLRSRPCQPPWPSSSFPRKWESRHGQLGWHNKMMKMILLRRRGWPKARGGFQMGKAFPKWNPPRPSATVDVHPSDGGDFLRSRPCQPPWPSSSFPRKWESRHGQLGWHNKMMKMIPLRRRGWPKARGGFQVGKAFPKWNPPRPSATADVHPSNGGDFLRRRR